VHTAPRRAVAPLRDESAAVAVSGAAMGASGKATHEIAAGTFAGVVVRPRHGLACGVGATV
jgi:hypothetical protein